MTVVKLQGGLGNQMFQYAAGRSLVNDKDVVYVDKYFFKKNTQSNINFTARKYELDIFKNIKAKEISPYHERFFNNDGFLYKLIRKCLRSSIKYIKQEDNEYKYISFGDITRYRYVYLKGYFQSEKYFSHITKQLLNEFAFPELDKKNESLKKQIESTSNAVSMHIRRGDYLKPVFTDVHGILPVKYYNKALDCLNKNVTGKTLFIFSDDIEWVKENLNIDDTKIFFIENNKAEDGWKDMVLMSACKHHIIANSSFSWWGAWLSKNQGNVYAPFNWFNRSKVKFNIHDFIPQQWNVVEYE